MGFTKFVKLDSTKIVMAGHSMGGATALRVGSNNTKINCVLTNDAWLLPLHKELYNNTHRGYNDKKISFVTEHRNFPRIYKSYRSCTLPYLSTGLHTKKVQERRRNENNECSSYAPDRQGNSE